MNLPRQKHVILRPPPTSHTRAPTRQLHTAFATNPTQHLMPTQDSMESGSSLTEMLISCLHAFWCFPPANPSNFHITNAFVFMILYVQYNYEKTA